MNRRPRVSPETAQAVQAARAEKAQLQSSSLYSWNVFRRLECLKVVERYLEQTHENPGQLLNVKAIMAGYMAPQGQGKLTWKTWAVSYWIRGAKGDEKHFHWDDCIEREGKANALKQSMWIEGADRAGPIPLRSFYTSPPPAVGTTFALALNLVFRVPGAAERHVPITFGTSIPIDPSELTAPAGSNNPGLFFLNQLVGRGEPEFIYENRRTTILLSPAVLGQIETAADSRAPELGYSVFHCGQGVLQVYRAVALEVNFANSDPESMESTWANCRCAISSDLGQDGVRLLYSIGDMSVCRDMIALEVEDDEDESNEDEE